MMNKNNGHWGKYICESKLSGTFYFSAILNNTQFFLKAEKVDEGPKVRQVFSVSEQKYFWLFLLGKHKMV